MKAFARGDNPAAFTEHALVENPHTTCRNSRMPWAFLVAKVSGKHLRRRSHALSCGSDRWRVAKGRPGAAGARSLQRLRILKRDDRRRLARTLALSRIEAAADTRFSRTDRATGYETSRWLFAQSRGDGCNPCCSGSTSSCRPPPMLSRNRRNPDSHRVRRDRHRNVNPYSSTPLAQYFPLESLPTSLSRSQCDRCRLRKQRTVGMALRAVRPTIHSIRLPKKDR